MSAFPSKSEEKRRRREQEEANRVARESRDRQIDRENNWEKYSLLDQVNDLSDTDETTQIIKGVLRYLLDRARD